MCKAVLIIRVLFFFCLNSTQRDSVPRTRMPRVQLLRRETGVWVRRQDLRQREVSEGSRVPERAEERSDGCPRPVQIHLHGEPDYPYQEEPHGRDDNHWQV